MTSKCRALIPTMSESRWRTSGRGSRFSTPSSRRRQRLLRLAELQLPWLVGIGWNVAHPDKATESGLRIEIELGAMMSLVVGRVGGACCRSLFPVIEKIHLHGCLGAEAVDQVIDDLRDQLGVLDLGRLDIDRLDRARLPEKLPAGRRRCWCGLRGLAGRGKKTQHDEQDVQWRLPNGFLRSSRIIATLLMFTNLWRECETSSPRRYRCSP